MCCKQSSVSEDFERNELWEHEHKCAGQTRLQRPLCLSSALCPLCKGSGLYRSHGALPPPAGGFLCLGWRRIVTSFIQSQPKGVHVPPADPAKPCHEHTSVA